MLEPCGIIGPEGQDDHPLNNLSDTSLLSNKKWFFFCCCCCQEHIFILPYNLSKYVMFCFVVVVHSLSAGPPQVTAVKQW